MADPASWSVRRQTAPAVRLRPGANDALDPRDQIDVRQTQLPLGIALEVYDANGLSDAGTWRLVGTGGVAKMSDLTDVFPTRRYLRKPPKDQPFRGGLASGARFGSTAWSVPAGAVASDESLTEDRVLDSLMVPPPQPATGHPLNVGVHFAEAILIAAPTRAAERKWTRHVVALEATRREPLLPALRAPGPDARGQRRRAGERLGVVPARVGGAARRATSPRTLALAGPGDVLAIEPRQVLRVSPAAGARDAEPDFFPLIEFDAPELPWAYSPTLPAGSRLAPWLVLVVVEADPAVRLERGAAGPEPVDPAPARRSSRAGNCPTSADAATWAHAQIACETAAQIAATLAAHPDRTLSRLLAPRRLQPNRGYIAAVVPAYLSGRIAGLGEDPTGHPALVTGLEPAWSALDVPTRLPAYYAWTFRTGEAGDFESLAQRLHAVQLDPEGERTALHLSLPSGTAGLAVDWEAPLRVPEQVAQRPRRPAAAVNEIRTALRGGTNPPILGPSYFGEPWTDARAVTPVAAWAPEVNLTPALRAAAGLGADVVRAEQDALVEAARTQLDAFTAAQREGRRRQLATAFVNRVAQRLAAAPVKERQRVTAPMAVRQRQASNVGVYTVAGRRIARKTWLAVSGSGPEPESGGGPAPAVIAAIHLAPLLVREPAVPPPPPPPQDAAAIPTGAFTPRFSRPLSEPLAERFPELMLPGLGSIPAEGVALVETNEAFVEAFLLGANQELNYELLWRGLPSDRRATAFRRFWGRTDDGDDIDHVSTWTPDSAVGSHTTGAASMVLLVRGELVRRYPSMTIATVPAAWNTNESRSPVADAAQLRRPAFRGRIGEDVLYAGFAGVTPTEAVGSPAKADNKPGLFFLLAENPGDPRFGLDPDGGTTPPTRATLSWAQLTLPAGASYATLPAFPVVPDAGFNPATATPATMANLVRQRPFRAFMHASLLVRPTA